MKPSRPSGILFSLVIFSLFFSSCKDEVVSTYTYRTKVPVYMTASAIRSEVISPQAPKELESAGRIYIYGKYLLINEPGKGLHIVDNSNPSNPRFLNYINIPGNSDMAINSNILYADSYMDLLAFNIADPANIGQPKRVADVFKSSYPENKYGEIITLKDTIITTIHKSEVNHQREMFFDTASSFSQSAGGAYYGTGGSTARFTLMNGFLYTVDQTSLKLFDVNTANDPKYIKSIQMGWGIETIFPYQNKLFIGSTTGMHIFNASDASAPVKLSTYSHITSCDPVVVQGDYAYVTLRSGTSCRMGSNLLEVISVSNPASPKLESSYPMLNPHGLSISGSNLFVCEGAQGLKSFDSSDPVKVGEKQISFLKNIDARDVIAGPSSLIVTGRQGIYQYNYSDPAFLKLLSHISVSDTDVF